MERTVASWSGVDNGQLVESAKGAMGMTGGSTVIMGDGTTTLPDGSGKTRVATGGASGWSGERTGDAGNA